MNGIINFFKPKGMTSHGAVNFLRKKLNIRRIGHTGTLDPEVSGVLPLCIGKATRVSEYLLDANKEYIGELTLGIETESQDMEGKVVNRSNLEVSEDEIRKVFSKYIGEIEQIPPMYSALKHKGQKLYELAREGKEVERKKRKVILYENEILDISGNKILFKTLCSKGTYIRTLCHDIGNELGTYGYMSYLIRTEVDDFSLEKSIGKEFIERASLSELEKYIIPMDFAVKDFEKIDLPEEFFFEISNGTKIDLESNNIYYSIGKKDYRVYCKEVFIGIGTIIEINSKKHLKMKKVLLT